MDGASSTGQATESWSAVRGIVVVALLALGLAACMGVPRGAGLSRPLPVSNRIDRSVWLARVTILDPDVPDKAVVEDSLTLNLLEYVQEAGCFRTVNVLPGTLSPQDHVLRLQFDRYRQQRAPHPAYFPGALLTLTLWIWVGGPIYTDTADLSAQLHVEDARGIVLTTLKAEKKESHSVSLWSPQYALPSGIEGRTAIVKDLFEKATNYMQQRKEGL